MEQVYRPTEHVRQRYVQIERLIATDIHYAVFQDARAIKINASVNICGIDRQRANLWGAKDRNWSPTRGNGAVIDNQCRSRGHRIGHAQRTMTNQLTPDIDIQQT